MGGRYPRQLLRRAVHPTPDSVTAHRSRGRHMIRTTALPAAALLGLTLLVPTSAHAAGETCRGAARHRSSGAGRPAAHRHRGTGRHRHQRRDEVDALGGDDLVCVTGTVTRSPTTARTVEISAGHGNDSVEVVERALVGTGPSSVTGRTRFVSTNGGRATWSTPGRRAPTPRPTSYASGRLGGGHPPGSPVRANADVIDLSAGGVTWQGIQAGPGSVSTGGARFLRLDLPPTTEQVLERPEGHHDVRRHCSRVHRRDDLRRHDDCPGRTPLLPGQRTAPSGSPSGADRDYGRYVAMGGADDVYESDSLGSGGRNDEVRGNGGRDHLLLNLPKDEVEVDTSRAGSSRSGREAASAVASTRGFEDLTLGGALTPTSPAPAAASDITVVACRATVSARKGADVTSSFTDEIDDTWDRPRCGSWRAVGGRRARQRHPPRRLRQRPARRRPRQGPRRGLEAGATPARAKRRRTCELRR